MELSEILRHVDHTNLKVDAVWKDIQALVDEAIRYQCASVCIQPSFVKQAAEYAAKRVKICTVIGFPNGYNTVEAKCFEASQAVNDGAEEIDMVINVGWLKAGLDEKVTDEIKAVKKACQGRRLKVIIEACLLTEEEKIRVCRAVSAAGADYIKTSTGFSVGGAAFEDVALMRKYSDPAVKVKAAGGIRSIEDAQEFLRLGADRLGTSSLVKIAIQNEKEEA